MVAPIVAAAGISGGASILGGLFGSRAASRGAQAQKEMFQQGRKDQKKGVKRADQILRNSTAETALVNGYARSAPMVRGGYESAMDLVRNGARQQRNVLADMYSAQQGLYQPVLGETQMASDAYLYEVGAGARPNGYRGFEKTPGYQFQMDEMSDAVQGSAAGAGGLYSGATMKALNDRAGGIAAQGYDNHLNRLLGIRGQNLGARDALAGIAGNYGMADASVVANRNNVLADLSVNMGTGLGGMRTNLGTNIANMRNNEATNRANLWGGLGQNLSQLSVGQGNAAAQGYYNQGNAMIAGTVGAANAANGYFQNQMDMDMFNRFAGGNDKGFAKGLSA